MENVTNNVQTVKKRGRKSKNLQKTEVENNVENVEKKVLKKRGRKPKNPDKQINEEKKVPKKRGRKPKDSIYSLKQIDNIIIKDESIDTVILHLPIHSSDIEDDNNIIKYEPNINIPEPYEKDDNNFEQLENYNNNVSNELYVNQKKNVKVDNQEVNNIEQNEINEIENDNIISNNDINKICCKKLKTIQYEFIDANHKKTWLNNTQIYCMWCCHGFDGIPISIPQKYVNDKFHVYGNFCSFNCAASYIFNKNDDFMWKQYNLLNLLQKKISDNNWKKIKLAPPKEVLKIFGGYLSIDEYRKELLTGETEFKIVEPPLVSLIPKIEETYFKSNNDINNKKTYVPLDNDLIDKAKISMKLKREKPINNKKSTLHNFMDLKII